nr:tail fiber protein [Caudoviricetes sp.]
MDFKLALENYQYCLVVNNADEGINLILQNKLPDGVETENPKENSLTVVNPTVIQMYVDVKTESAPTLQVSGENEDIKIVNVGVAKLKPQTINKIQFVTLDGGKVWIADFGNSGDESVQIAEISNEVKSAKTLAETAKSTADAANTAAGEAKNTAEAANTAAGEAKTTAETASSTATEAKTTAETANSTANAAKSTAETASSTATEAKNTANGLSSTVTEVQSTLATTTNTANQAKSTADSATTAITGLETRVQALEAKP